MRLCRTAVTAPTQLSATALRAGGWIEILCSKGAGGAQGRSKPESLVPDARDASQRVKAQHARAAAHTRCVWLNCKAFKKRIYVYTI